MMIDFKKAWYRVVQESQDRPADKLIADAFRNGIAAGLVIGTVLASVGWIMFFWLCSLV